MAILVIVLVVVDVVLVGFALSRTAPAENGEPGPVPTFSSTPRPPETGSPTPSAGATDEAAGQSASGRRLLSAVSASEAWRAVGGTCSGSGASLEHTTDGGTTWTPVALSDDVGTVLSLRAATGSLSVLVGVGEECDPTVRTSTDDGATWKAGSPGAAGAGIVSAGLVLPTGIVASPCSTPIDAFQGRYTTAVVCDDVVQWRSGTRAWVSVPVAGVRSIADNGDAYTIAQVGAAGCDGVEVASLPAVGVTSTTKVTTVGCATDAGRTGSITVARTGQTVWLWSGNDVLTSTDGGTSW